MDSRKKEEPCTVINVYCEKSDHPHPPCPPCPPCPPVTGNAIEFAEVISNVPQTLTPSPGVNMPGQVVTFENTIYATSNIDISQAASTGKITVKKSGWYDVATGLCGALNPVSTPLNVWTLSLFANGVIVTGSTFANMTISPAQQSNETVADVFVHLNAGDVITLANTSTAQVFLTAPTLGTNALPSSAYLKISLLKEDSSSGNPLVTAYNTSTLTALTAANLSKVSATTVNLSQSPSDALIAQTNTVALVNAINACQTALTAATSVSTPVSVTAATAAIATALPLANSAVTAANTAVSFLNPSNTAALMSACNAAQVAVVSLSNTVLVAL